MLFRKNYDKASRNMAKASSKTLDKPPTASYLGSLASSLITTALCSDVIIAHLK